MKFLCKFSTNPLITDEFRNWLGLLESENLKKTCQKTSRKVVPVLWSQKLPTFR